MSAPPPSAELPSAPRSASAQPAIDRRHHARLGRVGADGITLACCSDVVGRSCVVIACCHLLPAALSTAASLAHSCVLAAVIAIVTVRPRRRRPPDGADGSHDGTVVGMYAGHRRRTRGWLAPPIVAIAVVGICVLGSRRRRRQRRRHPPPSAARRRPPLGIGMPYAGHRDVGAPVVRHQRRRPCRRRLQPPARRSSPSLASCVVSAPASSAPGCHAPTGTVCGPCHRPLVRVGAAIGVARHRRHHRRRRPRRRHARWLARRHRRRHHARRRCTSSALVWRASSTPSPSSASASSAPASSALLSTTVCTAAVGPPSAWPRWRRARPHRHRHPLSSPAPSTLWYSCVVGRPASEPSLRTAAPTEPRCSEPATDGALACWRRRWSVARHA